MLGLLLAAVTVFERVEPVEVRTGVVRVRSVGTSPLVLIAVSRADPTPTDEFPRDGGSYVDC